MAAVEGPGLPGDEAAHASGEGAPPCPYQEVGVIGEARPGENSEGPSFREGREAAHEVLLVGVIPEEDAELQPPHHHVVEGVRGAEAGLTRHGTGEPSTQ